MKYWILNMQRRFFFLSTIKVNGQTELVKMVSKGPTELVKQVDQMSNGSVKNLILPITWLNLNRLRSNNPKWPNRLNDLGPISKWPNRLYLSICNKIMVKNRSLSPNHFLCIPKILKTLKLSPKIMQKNPRKNSFR